MGSITVDTKYGAIDFNLSGDQPNLQEKIKITYWHGLIEPFPNPSHSHSCCQKRNKI